MKNSACNYLGLLAVVLTSASAAADYKSQILSDNPAGYWRLDFAPPLAAITNSGSTAPGDSGVPATSLLLGQPGAIVGDTNTAALFDGATSLIEVPYDAAQNPATYSIECWAKVAGGGSGYRAAMSARESVTGLTAGYIIYADSANKWAFWTGKGVAGWNTLESSVVTATNVWFHLVGTYDATAQVMSFYINGALAKQATGIVAPADGAAGTPRVMRIGAGQNETIPGFFFNGTIDEVAVYPAALSLAQVQAHYAAGTNGLGTYASTITNDAPVAWYRLGDSPSIFSPASQATNSGSAGLSANLNILNGVRCQATGALTASSDTAMNFDGANDKLEIPSYKASLNPTGTVSVECWAYLSGLTNNLRVVVSSTNAATGNLRGYQLLADTHNYWSFRVWSGSTATIATSSNLLQYNTWTHLAGVFDGTAAHLFVNGVEATNPVTGAYAPATNTAFPFRIGASSAAGAGDSFFLGSIDEVAVYSNALSSAQILAHYQNGISASPATNYNGLILSAGPVGYWRLDEPAPAVVSTNLGWAGASANGTFFDGLTPGQPGALTGDSDTAIKFRGVTPAKIEVPYSAPFGSQTFTIEAWMNEVAVGGTYASPISGRDNVPSGNTRGWILYRDVSAYQFWTGNGGGGWDTLIAGTATAGVWHHLVGTFDGSIKRLFVDGVLVGMNAAPITVAPNLEQHINIGAGANETGAGNYFVFGSVDEVAFYTNALGYDRILQHYVTASGANPAPVAPAFVTQPQGVTNYEGSTVTLTASITGGLPFYYQWQLNGVNLTNQTNGSLIISNALAGNSGSYTLVVSNSAASPVTSSAAYVSIMAAPPIISQQPLSTTRFQGASVTFSVTAGGSLPLSYQWLSNGVPIAGALSSSFTLSNVVPAYATTYSVQITNTGGLLNSSNALLTVIVPTPNTMPAALVADQPAAYWRLDETGGNPVAADYFGGNNGTYLGDSLTLQGQPGALLNDPDTAAGFDTVAGSIIQVPYNVALNASAAFSIECWAQPSASYLNGTVLPLISSRDTINNGGYTFGYCLQVGAGGQWQFLTGAKNATWSVLTGPTVATNTWSHIVATLNGVNITKLYVNSVLVASGTVVQYGANGLSGKARMLGIGGNSPDDGLTVQAVFGGNLDEVAIYNYELPPARIQAHYLLGAFGTTNVPVFFTQQPESVTNYPGGNAVFSVQVDGTTPYTYQWIHGTVPLPGATNSLLLLTNVQPADGGNYHVTVGNPAGVTNSVVATLTVLPLPAGYPGLVLQSLPIAYWRLDEAAGPTIVDIWGGNDGTASGNVTYGQPGALLGDPDTALTFDGSTAKIDVPYAAALNPGVFTVECWAQVAEENGLYQSPLCERNGASSGANIYSGFMFYATPANIWSFWTGNGSAWQQLNGPAVVPGQWTHLVGTYDGATKSLYVNGALVGSVATGYLPTLNLPLRIGAGATEGAGNYWFNGTLDEVAFYGTPLSPALIAEHYLLGIYGTNTPPTVTQQPLPQTIIVGGSSTFSGAAAGSPPFSYQWQLNGATLAGATATALTVSNAYYTAAGAYTLVIANTAGSVTSSPAALTVMPAPTFANLTNGLVLHLPFEGTQLTDQLADTSGYSNNATAGGSPSIVPGQVGTNAISLSTSTAGSTVINYVAVSSSPSLAFGPTDDFSVAFWVKYSGLPHDLPMIGNSVGSTYQLGWVFTDDLGKLECSLVSTANSGTYIMDPLPNSPITDDGNWHNVVGIFDRTNQQAVVYVDGALAGAWSIAGLGTLDWGNAITLGQDPTFGYLVPGAYAMDDVGIWNRVLSGYDAAGIYAAGLSHQSFDVSGPLKITAHLSGGHLEVIWQAGTLLQATQATGPYTPVPAAVAPFYRTTAAGSAMFYRVKL